MAVKARIEDPAGRECPLKPNGSGTALCGARSKNMTLCCLFPFPPPLLLYFHELKSRVKSIGMAGATNEYLYVYIHAFPMIIDELIENRENDEWTFSRRMEKFPMIHRVLILICIRV